ncbi:MAG: ATP-dependent helicase [Flavobacteriales bacterium]
MQDYLKELNPSQQEAVLGYQGPSMVLAGAGSGKTRVLTYRIAHLIENGVSPFNILALTFTNKAAKEMRERIEKILGPEARNIWMGTFHSIFARILRIEHQRINFPSNFTIYDTTDSKNLIKTIVKELELDDKIYKSSVILHRISSAKNNLISAEKYAADEQIRQEDKMTAKPRMAEIYSTYQNRMLKSSAMDFDDLLFKTNVLLKDQPDVLLKYQHLFQYILVDEYQDTNFSQYVIVKKLAAANRNICVVGDDAQSIYSFRGADIGNILSFQKDYPEAQLFKLEQNYRSSKNIVNAANSIIANNKDQIHKNVWTANQEGEKIKVVKTATDIEESNFVARSIFSEKMNSQAQNLDFAILYRTNAQSRSIEESLRKQNIPYKIYGGLSFYQRKEIKELVAYFRLVLNPHDEEALKRVINFPGRGIGKTTIDKVIIAANNNGVSMWDIISSPNKFAGIGDATQSKLSAFVDMIMGFNKVIRKYTAYDLGQQIASASGISKEYFADKTPEGISRYENIQELLNGLKYFSALQEDERLEEPTHTLDKFMSEIALLTDVDNEKDEDRDKVTLMTIHAAKGLEFNHVYIVGLEENLFPSQLSVHSRTELEEERRLFYVALTRARKTVHLSYAQNRFRYGNITYSDASRFIEELNEEVMEKIGTKPVQRSVSVNAEPSTPRPVVKSSFVKLDSVVRAKSPSSSNAAIEEGSEVEHLRFGKGKVVSIDGNDSNRKATIDFENHGKKQLLLKFAQLKVIN